MNYLDKRNTMAVTREIARAQSQDCSLFYRWQKTSQESTRELFAYQIWASIIY
ncbi:hypothetical protein OESDEN_23259 [Oesophagostomum dentatum]|uniref:Uncharacterized protein n=1 Tax=Oesophagostomum dentatum TaxID=61180 RepID=A0A0B1RZQ2_OESDE|nr:hypothetical protein OESDEN_23259 [Oesophagostomum dentatum]